MAEEPQARPPSPAVLGVVGLGAVGAAAAVWPLADAAAFGPGWGRVLEVGIGAAFIGCGLAGWRRRPGLPVGKLLVVTGFLWWAHLLLVSRQPLLFAAGGLLQMSFLPVLAAAVLGFPYPHLRGWWQRSIVALTVVVWVPPAVVRALFLDPRDIGCRDCAPDLNFLLIRADLELVQAVEDVWRWLLTAALLLITATVLARLARATPPARRVRAPLYAPTVVWAAAYALYLHVPRLRNTFFDDGSNVDQILLDIFGIALATIPAAILFGMRRTRGRHLRVSSLVRQLGEERSLARLEEALRCTLGDPSLRVGVRARHASGGYVRANGEPLDVPEPDHPREAATPLSREGSVVAMLVHDRALLIDDRELVEAVAAAARLAVENHQLQDELRRSLDEVRASRARLVQSGDAERHRIERNLHDGAQQRLVSLGIALQLAELQLGEDADPALRASLAEMAEQMRLAIDELRELALGLHPAILTEQGLGAALESLARRSTVPVTLVRIPEGRLPEPVEAAAYFVVAEALTNAAKHAHATRVEVRAVAADAELQVEVVDNGIGGASVGSSSGLSGIIDRVQAVDGYTEIDSPRGGGTTIRVMIPVPARVATEART